MRSEHQGVTSLIGAFVVALAGCAGPTGQASPSAHPFRSCPSGTPAMIDRVDFFAWSGIQYTARPAGPGRALVDSDLGARYAQVRCTLTDHSYPASFDVMQDGNAAFLPVGAAVYRVHGYAPSFRLAARDHGQIVLYEADVNPSARTGSDLLDIAGKVTAIAVDSDTGDGTTPIATITDAAEVRSLVAMLLSAPVDQGSIAGHSGSRYFVALRLRDGTAVLRAYFRAGGELSRGILAPRPFQAAIEQAAARR